GLRTADPFTRSLLGAPRRDRVAGVRRWSRCGPRRKRGSPERAAPLPPGARRACPGSRHRRYPAAAPGIRPAARSRLSVRRANGFASAEVIRFVPRLPLDVAADRRHLTRRRPFAREGCLDRGAEIAARHRDLVPRPTRIELPPVDETAF